MLIQLVTLFPDMFDGVLSASMLKRAQRSGQLEVRVIPLRPFGVGLNRQTDDYPFGGGVGMLLRADVVVPAVEWAMMHDHRPAHVVLTNPQGRLFTQRVAEEFSQCQHLIVVAGHYEGMDERVRWLLQADEVSVGDVVLTGGEIPSMMMVDAVARLLPGVLGADQSARDDSFSRPDGLLEGPQYTRPEVYRGLTVPPVLLSGNHQAIDQYRQAMAAERTRERRPDLWQASQGKEGHHNGLH